MKTIFKFLILCLMTVTSVVWANYPNKPVKIIISLPPGSGPDVQLRQLAEVLSARWKQPVLVENKPGGSGMVALNQLTREPADGYTLAMFSVGDVVAFPVLYNKDILLNYVDPLAPFFTADMVLFASPEIKNIKELKQEIMKNPTYGSWAVGSIGHVVGAEFINHYSKQNTHVPYKDYGPWYIDTSNRALSFGFTSLGSGNAMYQSGKIHYLAIAANQRDQKFPYVPTIREATGLNITAQSWLGFFINKHVPTALKKQIEKDLRDAIASQSVQTSLSDNYFISMHNISLEDFRRQINKDYIDYTNNLKRHNITVK